MSAKHEEITIYEIDQSTGYWVYEGEDRKVLARICGTCSSTEAIAHVEDAEWHDTWDDGSVEWPCEFIEEKS